MRDQERQILDRLAAAKSDHQDLSELIDFYTALYTVQFEAKAQIASQRPAEDRAARQELVAAGEPQITFDSLGIEPSGLARLAQRIIQILTARGRSGVADESALAELQAESLGALAREVFDQLGRWRDHQASAQGLAELAVELALAPYVERAAEALAPQLDLTPWRRPF